MRTSASYPSDEQIQYATDLIRQRDLRKGGKVDADITLEELKQVQESTIQGMAARIEDGRLTKALMSEWIDKLLALPKVPQAKPPNTTINVPAGRYALRVPHRVNEISFFKVDRPEEGRWAGYIFVKQIVGPEEHAIRNRAGREEILRRILEAGVQESMLLYGQEIGECGHCGRRLTNDESREFGIGPVCRGKMGW